MADSKLLNKKRLHEIDYELNRRSVRKAAGREPDWAGKTQSEATRVK